MVGQRFEVWLVVVDQLRSVDKSRLVKRLGQLDAATADAVLDVLTELFAK